MLVLPISSVYQLESLRPINVIVIVALEYSIITWLPLLSRIAAIISVRANASIELRMVAIMVPNDDLVLVNEVLDRRNPVILQFLA